MILLGVDTCGNTGSVALGRLRGGAIEPIAETTLAGKTYAAELVPGVRAMLAERSIEVASIGAIVVVNGPGSFTGIRIGVSSAKAFAVALDIPLLALSRLAVLAAKGSAASAALEAGRGEFYFRNEGYEFLARPADAPCFARLVVCETAALQTFSTAILVEPPSATDALRVSLPQILAQDFADVATLEGNYLRRSDAEIFAKAAGKI